MRNYVGHKPVNGNRLDPVSIIQAICTSGSNRGFLNTLRRNMRKEGLVKAIQNRDNQVLFDWLMGCFSYQGISDAIADSFIAQHGNATYSGLEISLKEQTTKCLKLTDFEAFKDCGYRKSKATCNNPKLYNSCPVTNLNLRKGQLNQAAYSLFFFILDVCSGDLIGFIDDCLAEAELPGHPNRLALMRAALTTQLLSIFGIAQKLINMTFADLLLGGDPKRTRWKEVGGSMIAVDSLVHNFLHRTGILYHYDAEHGLGSACYGEHGCEKIIDDIARQIDCSKFDKSYPVYFPRFIQHAVWYYCAESGPGICNGNSIDDAFRCVQQDCLIFSSCGRITLKPR